MIKVYKSVIDEFKKFANNNPNNEVGAVLLGEYDVNHNIIVKSLFLCNHIGSSAEFTFLPTDTTEAWNVARIQNMSIIGTVHSHAQFDAFMSDMDKKAYIDSTSRNGHCYLIYSPRTEKLLCFETRRIKKGKVRFSEVSPVLIDSWDSEEIDIDRSSFRIQTERSSFAIGDNEIIKINRRLIPSLAQHNKKELNLRDPLKNIKKKNILIVGAGALSTVFCNLLSASAFKKITVIDFDKWELHNIVTSPVSKEDIGQFKADYCAKVIIDRATSYIETEAIIGDSLLFGSEIVSQYDMVITLTDNNYVRAAFSMACSYYHKWFFTAGTTIYNRQLMGMCGVQSPLSLTKFLDIEPVDYNPEYERNGCSSYKSDVQPQAKNVNARLAAILLDIIYQISSNQWKAGGYLRIYLKPIKPGQYSEVQNFFPAVSKTRKNIYTYTIQCQQRNIKSIHASLCKLFPNDSDKCFSIDFVRSFLSSLSSSSVIICEETLNASCGLLDRLPKENLYSVIHNNGDSIDVVNIKFI